MSLFRKQRTLHQRHAAAHAIGLNVVGIFHDLADELEHAASEHDAVALDAHQQAVALADLRDSAHDAAAAAERQAVAVRSLVS